jgi:hypothetical protein
MSLKPERERSRTGRSNRLKWLPVVVVEGAFFGVGTLGKIAGVVCMVSAGIAEIFRPRCLMQSNSWMPVGFERGAAEGTGDRLGINGLITARAGWHQKKCGEKVN